MKAVNLLPREAQRSFGALRGMGVGTTMLLGALAAAVVLVGLYVVSVNGVTSKREELQRVTAEVSTTQRQVAALKPYADLEALRQSLLERVRSLAGSRYDWPSTLTRVARAFPKNATLTEFDGKSASDNGTPTVALAGCTPSHDAVAVLIDRLRAVKGVQTVGLQSSTVGDGGDESCPHAEQFKLSVSLEGPPAGTGTAAAAGAPAGTPAAPAAATTTPNAAPAGGTP